jgi:hypothetical protein
MAVKRYSGTAWVVEAGGVPQFLGGFRNRIINGDFRINQRAYTSASNLASGSYGFDRWKSNFTNTTLTFTSAPQGQTVTINSGGGLQQVVERANMSAGTYVLTWTGTATGRVYNSGGSAPAYAASPVIVTLDGTADVVVEFTASGGTRTLQNVQLEAGSVPSEFERRPIGTELALCQRYYFRMNNINSAAIMGDGLTYSTTAGYFNIKTPVTMRVTPSLIETSGNFVINNAAAQYSINTLSIISGVTNLDNVNINFGSGTFPGTVFVGRILSSSTGGFIGIGAEL